MGVVLYGPSLALSQITGLKLWMIVGFAGVICTFYTSIVSMIVFNLNSNEARIKLRVE